MDMNISRAHVERNEEDKVEQEVPIQAHLQALVDPIEEYVIHANFRSAIQLLAQALKAQVNKEMVTPANPIRRIATSRFMEFLGRYPPRFYGFGIGEDPLEFVEEVSKVLDNMGVTSLEKVELVSFQLKGVAQVWHDQWRESRPVGSGPIEWEGFKSTFLDRFFPLEMREALVLEVINLEQGEMCVKEYARRFTQLSKYVPILVSDPISGMNKFVSGLFDLVENECHVAMFEHNMSVPHLIKYSLESEKKKLEGKLKEKKRVRMDDGNSSLKMSFGQNPSKVLPKAKWERESNPKSKRGINSESMLSRATCKICGKKHPGKCLASTKDCYGCGGSDHKMRDCPVLTAKGKEMKKIRTGALQARGEQECPPNVAPGMCFMLISIPVILDFLT
ncbi:hypothetical protein KY284_000812 [Solanum tuberosum]|nr:hypothetical protein KY284_000812 [Solanum tuberosum]